jgi:hypothetical protein
MSLEATPDLARQIDTAHAQHHRGPELVLRAQPGPQLVLHPLPRQGSRIGSDVAVGVLGGLIAVMLVAGVTAGGIWFWRSLTSGSGFALPFDLQQASRLIQGGSSDADSRAEVADGAGGANAANAASNGGPTAVDTSVVLWNRSREVVSEIRLSSVQDEKWGDDLLGDQTLAPGQSFTLSPGNAAGCRYDVLVKYESGSKAERRNVDFCAVSELVFDGRM